MASAEFGSNAEEKRPTVQVGDPFTEKRLLEACLELMASGAVISIQDMGAAGLTCSAVEMGDKGRLGIRLDLDAVPVREAAMTAYEMMLSESQERMLMVLDPEKEAVAAAIFAKWDLDFAVIGETIAEDRFLVEHQGRVEADLPLRALSGEAPEYDRPWTPRVPPGPVDRVPERPVMEALVSLLASPNYGSRRAVWEQYDHTVGADTVVGPGTDAAVVRVHGTTKALALSADVTPRYCRANPVEGGRQAVAEAYRNLIATGARPLAVTDNLNFGNPERPEIMGEFVGCIEGIGAACRALDMPVVSGNVSLYNETDGAAILPTPTIGAVGLIDDLSDRLSMAPRAGDTLVLLGDLGTHLGQSAYLAECCGLAAGDAPPLDLALERERGEIVRALSAAGRLSAVHDVSDGGIALCAVEMALAGDVGLMLDPTGLAELFGEDQGRYLLAVAPEHLGHVLGVTSTSAIGRFGGESVAIGDTGVRPLSDLRDLHARALASVLV
ncbi:MAG: phosphoribosylformylglycinamidine synthase subunit PurL, partial [Pseudomonadota bacterium]